MGRKQPLIGINCFTTESPGRYTLRRAYVDAVTRAGGIPVLLPCFSKRAEVRRLLDRLDAVVLSGGDDLHPSLWGERPHRKANIMPPFKQASDLLLARESLKRDVPILGICYGAQLINVVRGGSVHQHIPDLEVCRAHHTQGKPHGIQVDSGLLSRVMGWRSGRVNSFHHQSINRVGRGLRANAVADDGLVEGIEDPDGRFILGVQWHPERMPRRTDQARIFRALVRAGQKVV